MTVINPGDWSFENIQHAERARRLESAALPADLMHELVIAMRAAIKGGQLRIAIDSKNNQFVETRTICQFQVDPELYDWFFNARTGYRAQFWLSAETGGIFNRQIVSSLFDELSSGLPVNVIGRKIEVNFNGESREEKDVGTIEQSREGMLASFSPGASKIWICENLYGMYGSQPKNIGLSVLMDAASSPAKLAIPRWAEITNPKTDEKGEGLRAPFPEEDYSWLDLKGGFLGVDRAPEQIKPQDKRACSIHRYGWT